MYPILYEDNDVLVVNKPAGVSMHPDAHRTEGTLIQEIEKEYPGAQLAHRLDKDTSGVLLVAKNQTAFEYCKDLFREHKVEKSYITLVVGEVKKDEGDIVLAITRSTKDFRKRVATPLKGTSDARAAETHFTVLKRLGGYTLLDVRPKTGRTHQIRSHLSAIGHPVACDQLYGGKKYACPSGLGRQFLHAASLTFPLPSGKRLEVKADLPDDLTMALRDIAK
jgi:23S rRNA pseudouridine1911/1915/1917 synthase